MFIENNKIHFMNCCNTDEHDTKYWTVISLSMQFIIMLQLGKKITFKLKSFIISIGDDTGATTNSVKISDDIFERSTSLML